MIDHWHEIDKDEIVYYHTQLNGAPYALSSAQGELIFETEEYLWGNYRRPAQTQVTLLYGQPLRFKGLYFNQETGLHYNTFRYYDPETGRFTQQDPIGLAGGISFYQYAPNPIMWLEPLGWSFLSTVKDAIATTGKKFQGAEIYKFTDKIKVDGVTFRKGDYFYLDNLHKDHFETFSSLDKSKGVVNIDGSYNSKKSQAAAKRKGPGC